MNIYAISDLHLSLAVNKPMDVFGPEWINHSEKLRKNWDKCISDGDIVLVPGDISWALNEKEAIPDLDFISQRPGIKILVRGNHDYWWKRQSTNRLRKIVPSNIILLHRNGIVFENIGIAGTRGWRFENACDFNDSAKQHKLIEREIGHLEVSLKAIAESKVKIVMLHYPPFNTDLSPTPFADMLRINKVDILVYGHIHSGEYLEGDIGGVQYIFAASDKLNFSPRLIYSSF